MTSHFLYGRREFITLLGSVAVSLLSAAVLLFAGLGPVLAQTERLPKVGYLGFGAAVPPTTFQNRLSELGYAEGKSVVVQYRFADGRPGELPRLARELVDAKVDVIMAVGDEAILAAKNATRTVPIVIVACDAVTTGFVGSLARPGGNLSGVTCLTSELMQKRMAVFRELLPSLTRIAVLYNPENISKPDEAARTVALAREQGLDAHSMQFRTAEDIERAFAAFAADRPDGVAVLTEQRAMINGKLLAELARGQRLPTMHSFREGVDAGGFLSYGPNAREMVSIATSYIAKILRGAKPADLPVEQPTRFELVINLKTANDLGLTVPATLLARADEVIE
jgi:putative tryptophan/tyrosine transport system substrate-binding protein